MTYDTEHYYALQTFLEDDELTKICDDIYQTLMGAYVAQMMEIA